MLVNNINKIPPCFASTDMHKFQLCQRMSLPTSCSNCRRWSGLTVIAWSTSPAAIWTRLWGAGIYLIWSPYISFHAKKVCVINVNHLLRHQHASHEANSVSAPGQDQLYHFFFSRVCLWLAATHLLVQAQTAKCGLVRPSYLPVMRCMKV